jgi:hypothetical protein
MAVLRLGLGHLYQVEGGRGLEHVYSLLKGNDATVYQAVRTIGFKPVLYLYYYSSPSRWTTGLSKLG